MSGEGKGQTPGLADGPPAAASALDQAYVLEQLLDLAYDVSSYLRHHARPVVRISTALLLAASLSACATAGVPRAAPEASWLEEVRSGLPTGPGRYPVMAGSISRDARGVYHFIWVGSEGRGTPASASPVRLAQGEATSLEIPERGDPILHLAPDTPVQLAAEAPAGPAARSTGPSFFYWHPFPVGGYSGPGYYDPPPRTVPSGGRIEGSTASTVPRPPGERASGVPHAVSGQAGGTGAGRAATRKSGADVRPVGGKSAATGPKSSGFSSGKSASVGGSSS